MIYLLFWRGSSFGLSEITYYYLFFIVAGGLLFVHVEADAYEDIQQGQLSVYLIKPFSYLSMKFFSELPWRLIQGSFGLITLLIVSLFFTLPQLSLRLDQILTALVVMVFGYLIMFLFKMLVLLSALWFTDIGGLQQFSEMVVITLAGFIMPIRFFPGWAATIAYFTPFPYTIYFPIIAFQELIHRGELVMIIGAQLTWIFLLFLAYVYLWKIGLRKYSAVGQ